MQICIEAAFGSPGASVVDAPAQPSPADWPTANWIIPKRPPLLGLTN